MEHLINVAQLADELRDVGGSTRGHKSQIPLLRGHDMQRDGLSGLHLDGIRHNFRIRTRSKLEVHGIITWITNWRIHRKSLQTLEKA